jgi:uncharacterized membrane-anchored protein
MIQKKEENEKNILKKTTKRTFTLGKHSNKVSVLIKNKNTRKNIIQTQKQLRKTNILDVRKYLRQHGFIKVGSTCPNDVLRKTFETAMLAGDINNSNADILMHNYMTNNEKND